MWAFLVMLYYREQSTEKTALKQFYGEIGGVKLVLGNAEVTAGDCITTVIIDFHNNGRRNLLADTGMVSPSLSEAVAGDFASYI